MLELVGFVDPARVGAKGCGSVTERSKYIAKVIANATPDQIFLVPYNCGYSSTLSTKFKHLEAVESQ